MKIKVYFDDNYLEAFKNMIFSAVANKKSETKIILEVGLWGPEGSNLSANSRSSILDFCSKLEINVDFLTLTHFLEPSKVQLHEQRIPRDSQLARLSMLVQANSDFLFLDVDLLLQPGWDDLLNLSSPDPDVALVGVEDAWLKHHGMTQDEKYGSFYFNAGVFVCFYDVWKDHNFSELLISTISKVEKSEIEIRQSMYDQDILNILCAKNKGTIDKTFNCQINPAPNGPSNQYFRLSKIHHPRIIHFIGGLKPFNDLGKIKFDILNIAESNASAGYIDSTQNYFYLYYFVQNQRKIWEKNS
jgi:lipopolysaccharide biosynthesis glycosyltransferase